MIKQIKWQFKGTGIFFITAETSLEKDVMRQRERLQISPNTKIKIIDEFFTTDHSTTTGCSSCGDNSSNTKQPAVSMVFNEDEVNGDEAFGLPPVSDVLDDLIDNFAFMEDGNTSGPANGGDSVADIDTDGQVD